MTEEFKDRKGNTVIKPDGRIIGNRTSVYGIVNNGNKILLVRPSWKKQFDLPGGGIEKDENIYEGLKREFLEETGLSIKIMNKQPIRTEMTLFYADDIDEYFNSKLLFFLVKSIGKENIQLINRDEIKEVTWIDLDKLESESINKFHLEIIKELKRSKIL